MTPRRSVADALEWLDGHWNMEARSAGVAQGTSGRQPEVQLDRMRRLMALCADPQTAQPAVHITGTNGKTSVSRMTTALLAAAGMAVGLYTSPHLERINERIQATPFGVGRRQYLPGAGDDLDLDEDVDVLDGFASRGFGGADTDRNGADDADDLPEGFGFEEEDGYEDVDGEFVHRPPVVRAEQPTGFPTVPITDEQLAEELDALSFLEPMLGLEKPDDPGAGRASWFELVTAAALRWFADQSLDAAVIEVGLGGRWDATNVVDGAVAVITNVGLDHTEWLGPTRADIAMEKAGIIKPGSIVVVGETDPDLVKIFEGVAAQVGAEAVYVAGRDFGCESNRMVVGGRLVTLRTPWDTHTDVVLPVHGIHQGDNAALALTAAEAMVGRALGADLVAAGFDAVSLPGRLEIVARRPLTILDGAHNAHGAAALGLALADELAIDGKRILVLGALQGHDPTEFLEALGTDNVALVVACPAPSPRTLPAADIAAAADRLGVASVVTDSVADAVARARQEATPDDMILVTGSLYVVGAARAELARDHQ